MKKFLFLMFFLLCGCGDEVILEEEINNPEQYEKIIIDIQGAINNPGIYEVSKGIYLYEIIELAGGLRSDADVGSYNAVDVIESSTVIRILSLTCPETSSLININTASIQELMALPGIGSSKANTIIEYRNKVGRFKNIEELKNVSGIGESLYNQLKPYITI